MVKITTDKKTALVLTQLKNGVKTSDDFFGSKIKLASQGVDVDLVEQLLSKKGQGLGQEASLTAEYPKEEKGRRLGEFVKQVTSTLPTAAAVGASFTPVGSATLLGRMAVPAVAGGVGELARQAITREPLNIGKAGMETALSAGGQGLFEGVGTLATKALGATTGLGKEFFQNLLKDKKLAETVRDLSGIGSKKKIHGAFSKQAEDIYGNLQEEIGLARSNLPPIVQEETLPIVPMSKETYNAKMAIKATNSFMAADAERRMAGEALYGNPEKGIKGIVTVMRESNAPFDREAAIEALGEVQKLLDKKHKFGVIPVPKDKIKAITSIFSRAGITDPDNPYVLNAADMDDFRNILDGMINWTKGQTGRDFTELEKTLKALRWNIRNSIDYPGYKEAMSRSAKIIAAMEKAGVKNEDDLFRQFQNWTSLGPRAKKNLFELNSLLPKEKQFVVPVKNIIREKNVVPPKPTKPTLPPMTDIETLADSLGIKNSDDIFRLIKQWETLGPQTKKDLYKLNSMFPSNKQFKLPVERITRAKEATSAVTINPYLMGAGVGGMLGAGLVTSYTGNPLLGSSLMLPTLLASPAITSRAYLGSQKPVNQLLLKLGAQTATRFGKQAVTVE